MGWVGVVGVRVVGVVWGRKWPGPKLERELGGGGGCIFIYSCSARRISFQIDQFEFDLKRNSLNRT